MLKKKSNNEYFRLYGGKIRYCATFFGDALPQILRDKIKAGLLDFAPELNAPCPLKVPWKFHLFILKEKIFRVTLSWWTKQSAYWIWVISRWPGTRRSTNLLSLLQRWKMNWEQKLSYSWKRYQSARARMEKGPKAIRFYDIVKIWFTFNLQFLIYYSEN